MVFYWLLFITGFTSAFNCVALQMGLLGSAIAAHTRNSNSYAAWATGTFLAAKLAAYIVVGFLLGWVGESLALSDGFSGAIELVAGLYIVVAALAVLGVHPALRYVLISPPRFLSRFIRTTSKNGDLFTPVVLGFLTIFIPCGTTVAVEALVLHHGSPLKGMGILGAFTLGTMPVFVAFGGFANWIRSKWGDRFDKVSAIIVLALGLWAIYQTIGELVR